MLPLWRNRVYIVLSPEHLTLVKLGRGLKPKLLGQLDEVIQPPANQNSAWQTAVDRLAQVLALPEWQGADANIVLSNRLARFAVIPPNTQLKKYTAQEAFARHMLSQTYGAAISQWTLRIQPGKPAEPWLVSAIEQSLLDNVKQICAANKLSLDQVTPWLGPIFNRFRNHLSTNPAWLVINEPGASLCILIKAGEIVCVSNLSHESINDLPALLDRENLRSNLPAPCKHVYLHTASALNLTAMNKKGYEINRLEFAAPEGMPDYAAGHYGIALSGVLSCKK